jgi:predicted metal-dependent peptidase
MVKDISVNPEQLLELSDNVVKGLSNHQRMMLKKVGRAGKESKSRSRRNSQRNNFRKLTDGVSEDGRN